MYARIFSAHFQPDKLGEASRVVQELIAPVVQLQKGNKSVSFLLDEASGKGMIVTVWATEADRDASEHNGFLRQQIGKLATLVAGRPSVERFEVVVGG